MATHVNGNGTVSGRYHATSSQQAVDAEAQYAAHNYHPLPVVFARAKGTSVWDPVCLIVSVYSILTFDRKENTILTFSLHTLRSIKDIATRSLSRL
jgi:hypothetical protein